MNLIVREGFGEPLREDNAAQFRAKTQAILCEHYLSARARRLGIELFQINPWVV